MPGTDFSPPFTVTGPVVRAVGEGEGQGRERPLLHHSPWPPWQLSDHVLSGGTMRGRNPLVPDLGAPTESSKSQDGIKKMIK